MANHITPFEKELVRGFLHQPATPSGSGLVITHGAGANCTSALLVAVADAFCAAGFCVLRLDLPFRQRRPFGPPHPSTASEDRRGIAAALHAMRSLISGPLVAGGHSYGGRQVSLLAAETSKLCEALLLLSYPLHPPNKPAQARTAHFPLVQAPALFVHGTKDPFGSLEEMSSAMRLIPSHPQLVPIDGAGHDLNRGKFDLAASIIEPLSALCRPLPGPR